MIPAARGTAALLVLLFAAAVGLHVVQANTVPAPGGDDGEDLLYVQSPEIARRAALSYDSLLADLYWVRAVQYYGRTKLSETSRREFPLLYPLLDFATSLDPRFDIAYRFGAVFLAEPFPNGAGRPDQAIALLEKGLRVQPEEWWFASDIGFVHYFWLNDYEQAAAWFERASRMPGGPPWMRAVAARVLAEGGNRASSRRLWQAMLEGDSPQYLRDQASRRLQQLDALDQVDTLNRMVSASLERTGVRPGSWRALIDTRTLPGVPLDPSGVPYVLDPITGIVSVSPESPLQPLPLPERPR